MHEGIGDPGHALTKANQFIFPIQKLKREVHDATTHLMGGDEEAGEEEKEKKDGGGLSREKGEEGCEKNITWSDYEYDHIKINDSQPPHISTNPIPIKQLKSHPPV